MDGSGNVVVTGSSYNTDNQYGNDDYYTAKYAASNGALLWEKRYSGSANNYDYASAVGLDGSGNVVVTGSSWDGSNADYDTVKYAAATGALLWERRYNGPANGDDRAFSVAIAPNGMVAVSGSSSRDYATVLYREIPGPLSFADWATGFGFSGGAAAAADPDRDGLSTGAEYILGGNLTLTDGFRSPTAMISGGNMVFTFARDDASETADVTLTVETGTNLISWPTIFNIGPTTAASSPGVSILENGAALDTITVTIPRGTAAQIFARLKATFAP